MPEPAQPGRARVWERAVVERQRARRRVRGEVIGLRILVKCYRIFSLSWRWCFAGVFVKKRGAGCGFKRGKRGQVVVKCMVNSAGLCTVFGASGSERPG